MKSDGTNWTCNADATSALPTCTANQIAMYNGSAWICETRSLNDLSDGKIANVSVFLGATAGNATPGNYSVGIGYESLFSDTGGTNNVAIGSAAMRSNTNSVGNVAIGGDALRNHNTGSDNTGVGAGALFTNSGTGNVALGRSAGGNNGGNSNRLYIDNSAATTPLIGGDFITNRVGINTDIASITDTLTVGGSVKATSFSGDGSGLTGIATMPTGGTTGQMISKVDATNYNTQWSTIGLNDLSDGAVTGVNSFYLGTNAGGTSGNDNAGFGYDAMANNTGANTLVSLSRFADGADTNDNSADFLIKCITPGAANSIVDSTGCYAITIDNPTAVTEGNTGTTTINFTVSLSHAATQAVTATYTTADDTATVADNDYASGTNTVTFAAGSNTAQTVAVTINSDTIIETPSETFYVNLTNPSSNAQISTAQGIGTITDDDFGITISTPTTAAEGGATSTYTVTLDSSTSGDVTISVTPDTQCTVSSTTLILNDSGPTGTVTAVDDAAVEGTHICAITHAITTGSTEYPTGTITSATVSITDNDSSPPPPPTSTPSTGGSTGPAPTTSADTPIVQFAGDGNGSVSASANSSGSFSCNSNQTCPTSISVGWYRFEPTADSDSKFVGWSGNNCNNGEYTTTFGGTCIATFSLLPPSIPVDDTPVVPTDPDTTPPDDTTPTVPATPDVTPTVPEVNYVGFSDQTYTVAENGGSVIITINRTGTVGQVSVDLITTDDSAKAGVNYQPITQTLFWANGDNTPITVSIPIIDNDKVDGNKTITISLGNAVNAELASGLSTAILTIVDDNDEPQDVVQPVPTEPIPDGTTGGTPDGTTGGTPDGTTGGTPDGTTSGTPDGTPTTGYAPPMVSDCIISTVLNIGCNARQEIITELEIDKYGHLAQGILDTKLISKGRVSNQTITPNASIDGGY